jgi:uroporphyrinogen decarboxylase
MTTPRENVKNAFAGGRPERIPVGVSMGGSWPLFIEGFDLETLSANSRGNAAEVAEIFYKVNDRVDSDFVTTGTGSTAFLLEALGGGIRFAPSGEPIILTPPIDEETALDDLDAERILTSDKIRWLRDITEETIKINQGKRSIFISARAPFTLAGQMYGIERFSKAIYKNRALVERLLAFATDVSALFYEFVLEVGGVDGVFIADPNASGDLISRKHYEDFALPYFKEVLRRLRPKGKLSLLHICGSIEDRLDLIAESGVQMISIDSKVDLRGARDILQGRIGLAGNVDPVAILESDSPESVYMAARKCIADAGEDGGFMLMPGCGISSRVPVANVTALVKAAHDV